MYLPSSPSSPGVHQTRRPVIVTDIAGLVVAVAVAGG